MKSAARTFEICFALFWTGISLISIYVFTILANSLPVRFGDPAWIEQLCASLRGGVSFPLIAMVLILLGAHLDNPEKASTYLPRLSRLAYLAALGFFLLIPLQTWASVKLLNLVDWQERSQLGVFTKGVDRIRLALTYEQLSEAIVSIPGAPRVKPGSFNLPLPQARQMLIQQIEPQLARRRVLLRQAETTRWNQALPILFKDALVALFAALGFAAIGRARPDSPTLLERLLYPGMSQLTTLDPHVQSMAEAEAEAEAQIPTEPQAGPAPAPVAVKGPVPGPVAEEAVPARRALPLSPELSQPDEGPKDDDLVHPWYP